MNNDIEIGAFVEGVNELDTNMGDILERDPKHVNVKQEDDLVNNPSHYTFGGIECLDALEACMSEEEFKGFLKGSCFKYLWRYSKKGNPLMDLEKCSFFLNKLISKIEKETE